MAGLLHAPGKADGLSLRRLKEAQLMKHRNRRMLIAILGHGRGPALREAPGDGGGEGSGSTGSTDDGAGKDGDGTTEGDSKTPKIDGDYDKERGAKAIAAARASEAKARADAKAANERMAAVLKAAGLTPDGKEDPAEALKKAAEERDKATTTARETALELAVYKVANKADSGVNAEAVLDSRSFRSKVADLDPSSSDFGDKVSAAIKDAVKANPNLAAAKQGAAGKSGGDFSSGTGAGQPISEEQLAKMSNADKVKALREGKLQHLL